MKKIGIVGGLGPESTMDYYKGIIDAFFPTYEKKGYPEISIESMDLHSVIALMRADAWDKIAKTIASRFERLREGGAELGAIASNTPHKMFKQIQSKTSLPLISIVEATCEYANRKKLKKLCLLGTELTMSSNYYQQVFDRHSVSLIVPTPDEQAFIQHKLFTEIEFGIIKDKTKTKLLSIVESIQNASHPDGLILGCTELPLIIKSEDVSIPCLNTTSIHISKIVAACKA